jgi:hypothetical protein
MASPPRLGSKEAHTLACKRHRDKARNEPGGIRKKHATSALRELALRAAQPDAAEWDAKTKECVRKWRTRHADELADKENAAPAGIHAAQPTLAQGPLIQHTILPTWSSIAAPTHPQSASAAAATASESVREAGAAACADGIVAGITWPTLRESVRSIFKKKWELSGPGLFASWTDYMDYNAGSVSITHMDSPARYDNMRANLEREVAEVHARGDKCESCFLACTPAAKCNFNWAHKKGSERRNIRELMIGNLIRHSKVQELDEEFKHVWLQCQICHQRLPDWAGPSSPAVASEAAASEAVPATAPMPAPDRAVRYGFNRFRRGAGAVARPAAHA